MVNNLGKFIKQLRQEREWSQGELSKRSGIDRSTIAYLETGRIAKPPAETFIKLAHAFNIRPEELYQAAGYIRDSKALYPRQETPEEILERLKVSIATTVPIYDEFLAHAGTSVEPVDYLSIVRERARGRNLEGYIVHGDCLEPEIHSGDIIIIDRDGQIDTGNHVACLFNNELHLGRLRKIADEVYLENNHGRMKLADCQVVAPIIEVRRRLK